MRGPEFQQDAVVSTGSPDARVPKDHPLRPIRAMVDAALNELDCHGPDRQQQREIVQYGSLTAYMKNGAV